MKAKLLVTQNKITHVLRRENVTYRNQISDYMAHQLYNLSVQLIESQIYHYLLDQSFLMIHFEDMLINIIEENGRPHVLKVKDRYVYSLLYDICAKLNIFVQIEPRLRYLET